MQIKHLKDRKINNAGVNLIYPIAKRLYKRSLLHLFKLTIYSLFFRPSLLFFDGRIDSSSIYIFSDIERDHLKRINKFYINDLSFPNIKLSNAISLLRPILVIFKSFLMYRKIKDFDGSIFFKIVLALNLSKCFCDVNYLNKEALKLGFYDFNFVFSLCDINEYESILVQLANVKKKKTLTNQHGQYRYLNHRNMSSDAEQYLSMVSSNILVWGKATYDEFSSIPDFQSKMIIFGSFFDKNIVTKTNKSRPDDLFGVILNGSNCDFSNLKLINIAKEYSKLAGKKFIIRLHQDNTYKYKNMNILGCIEISIMTDEYYFSKTKFSISHMSGLFLTCLKIKHRVFILKDDYLPRVLVLDGINFLNASSLLEINNNDYDFSIIENFTTSKSKKDIIKMILNQT